MDHAARKSKQVDARELNRAYYDEQAPEYDDCVFVKARDYSERHNVILNLMGALEVGTGPVMELGLGTGILAEKVMDRFPTVQLVGYDISDGMLEEACKKLARFGGRVVLMKRDITSELPPEEYQVIYTSSAIHHIHSSHRPGLFSRLYWALRPGGALIVSDRFHPTTQELEEFYDRILRRDMEAQGLDLQEYDKEIQHGHHLGASTSRYTQYMSWMRKAGFVDVDCVYKYLATAVIYGQRPPA